MQDLWDMYTMLGIELMDFTLPECDSDGYYQPMQCYFHGCHCVDRYGTPTSEISSGEFPMTCPETGSVLADEASQ